MVVKEFNSDAFLVCELQKGNEVAFDYLFRKHYKNQVVNAKSYVYDLDKAQSLVQDCFVKLWTNRTAVGDVKNLSSYLSFMVRNRCIDYIRKTKSEKALYDKIDRSGVAAEADVTLLKREFDEKLIKAILLLPKRSKLAFQYSRFENLTYREIGDKMNISGKAVEALVGRALRILRKDFNGYFFLFLCLFIA
ncbi:RNA polymerase sigma-70 factor, ECF subfamily [Algibacter lectus]|uniref:RNA polymerase sigma factor n=1 Tax=Algibacter lectus TaxID=221126 RepID=UPI0008E17CEB|nr:sigma-70 family RNA polymerase sigma factor [Algibacter lectus]SFB87872.1 RNA polymerase sigma-70 factor, ECF subfamily [Algibacter lectus]